MKYGGLPVLGILALLLAQSAHAQTVETGLWDRSSLDVNLDPGNIATITQDGMRNRASINQAYAGLTTGNGNTATVVQQGSHNSAKISQRGQNETATVEQYGSSLKAEIIQTKDNTGIMIKQIGSGGPPARVIQR
jgi:hypothetical protein